MDLFLSILLLFILMNRRSYYEVESQLKNIREINRSDQLDFFLLTKTHVPTYLINIAYVVKQYTRASALHLPPPNIFYGFTRS